jgi:hypothetical protein
MSIMQTIESTSTFTSIDEQINAIVERTKEDVGAPFEPESIELFKVLKEQSNADWQRTRTNLKDANKSLLIVELDKAIRGGSEGDQNTDSIADTLTGIALAECELFHDDDKVPYASFTRESHTETWPVWSKGFNEWLSWRCFEEQGKSPRKTSMDDALATIAGNAKFAGEEKEVAFRVGQKGNAYYLDLADEHWRAIEISANGWKILDCSPIPFVRTSSMKALPEPVPDGDLSLLWNFANIPIDDHLLVLTWLLETLRPDTPFALLELTGEQGSAKSSTQSVLRDLIDPNQVNLRAAPKCNEDIFIAAKNNHFVSYENISHLSASYQDTLCVLATGGGFASRTLYSNTEETVIKIKRPVVLNGISAVVVAQDLLSRTVNIMMPEVTYRDALQLKTEFEQTRPAILGGLLDLFVRTLMMLPSIDIPPEQRPRLADMAKLGEAIARSMGYPPGVFLSTYEASRSDAIQRTIDASPVAVAALTYLENNPSGFTGPTKELFEKLRHFKPEDCVGWPKSSKGFADAMRRASPALRILGVEANMNVRKTKKGIECTLKPRDTHFSEGVGISPKRSSPSSPCSPFSQDTSANHQKGELGEHGERYIEPIPPPHEKRVGTNIQHPPPATYDQIARCDIEYMEGEL